eukprot:TRINITY_DN49532_c0_g1_i1.p1 TRINITY_DN49532_c0_g1~~TRINITY_DN49532_c0_g1_i1.p1  ORF type:complete len:710 (-),score=103.73 TRINITY_DN49532_c0_g1_i1:143-2272(-)
MCWSGPFTRQRCCVRGDLSCWDGGKFTEARCCGSTNLSSAFWWYGGAVVHSWPNFVLWSFSARATCMSSLHLSRELCCSAPDDSSIMGSSCWDGFFSHEHCCKVAADAAEVAVASNADATASVERSSWSDFANGQSQDVMTLDEVHVYSEAAPSSDGGNDNVVVQGRGGIRSSKMLSPLLRPSGRSHHSGSRRMLWPDNGGDLSCWAGGFTFEQCCIGTAEGNPSCFDGSEYTFEGCCSGVDPMSAAAAASVDSTRNKSSPLSRAAWRGLCQPRGSLISRRRTHFSQCDARWREMLLDAETLFDRRVQEAARALTQSWMKDGRLWQATHVAPAFAVSASLHAAVALIDAAAPLGIAAEGPWAEVQELVSNYRENVGRIRVEDLEPLQVAALDELLQRRIRPYYDPAVQHALFERIEYIDQGAPGRSNLADASFLVALRDVADALTHLSIDYVPIQGTLIALLRYGSFPVGRLSAGKEDVVDNDGELLLFLDPWEDYLVVAARVSLALESRGWPPCMTPHTRKIVCFSLAHAAPCKVEIYVAYRDKAAGAIFAARSCGDGVGADCSYENTFPFQHWGGRMPWDIVYPFGDCRAGAHHKVLCPNRPISFLRGWSDGEYDMDKRPSASADVVSASCIALPVLSKDRDKSDTRNVRFQEEGLNREDLRLLVAYSKSLERQGLKSFHGHLDDAPCLRRRQLILAGDLHAGLSHM